MTITISRTEYPNKAFREIFNKETENGRRLKTKVQKSKKVYSRKNNENRY